MVGILNLVTRGSVCINKWDVYTVRYNVLFLCFDGAYVLFINTVG